MKIVAILGGRPAQVHQAKFVFFFFMAQKDFYFLK
jgi:hypothetical protein